MKQLKSGFKPVWNGKIEEGTVPPYYDGLDLHVHQWKKGYLQKHLCSRENPHEQTFSQTKIFNFNQYYCTICHCIKPNQPYVDPNFDSLSFIAEQKMKKMTLYKEPYVPLPPSAYSKKKEIVRTKKPSDVSWLVPMDRITNDYIYIEKKIDEMEI